MKELLDNLTKSLGLSPDQQPLVFIGLGVVAALLLALFFWIAARSGRGQGARRQSIFDKLGLSPFERRLVVAIFVVLFAVLQWWFVFPEFKKWDQAQGAIDKGKETLQKFQPEVDKLDAYQKEVERLEVEGHKLASEEVAVQLLRVVQGQAARSGVQVQNYNPGTPRPAQGNVFFEEQSLSLNFNTTGDKELLDFLVALSADNSFLRVRDLTVKPDASGAKLMGSVTVIASYQKIAAANTATPTQRRP